MNRRKVVVIGGGTGTFVALTGLRKYPLDLSVVVSTMDSGGSTGRLRDQLGVLPPGDLRQALVALSESSELWRELFTYRFEFGDLGGHSFGNIFLSALEKTTGSSRRALKEASKILNIQGSVVPVTFSNSSLCAEYSDGSIVEGEDKIDKSYTKRPRIRRLFLKPKAKLNPKVVKAISSADFIVLGPGDLYTSIIPNLLISNITDVIAESAAKKIYIVNLMTKLGQTDGFTVSDHIMEIDKYLKSGFLDYVLVNNKAPSRKILEWYKKKDNVDLVKDDLYEKNAVEAKVIRANVLSKNVFKRKSNDSTKRSLIRHDPDKLAKVLVKIIDRKA